VLGEDGPARAPRRRQQRGDGGSGGVDGLNLRRRRKRQRKGSKPAEQVADALRTADDRGDRRLQRRLAVRGRLQKRCGRRAHRNAAEAHERSARLGDDVDAARALDRGDEARVEIGLIKVVGARMLHNVIDRALQVHGALGLTPDTPLDRMYRHARFARIYDGPDEVHVQSTAKRLLGNYVADGPGWDFGLRG